MTTLSGPIQTRQGAAAAWTSNNPTLLLGEEGLETDTGRRKVGDGSTAWSALPYWTNGVTPHAFGAVGDGVTDDAVALQAFFDYVTANNCGAVDVSGTFVTSVPLVFGAAQAPATKVFGGRFFLKLTGTGTIGLTIKDWTLGYWEYLQINGTGSTGAGWDSWTWNGGVLFDNSRHNKFGQMHGKYFGYAFIIAGHSNNSINDYGSIEVSDCGSGHRNGSSPYGVTTILSNPVDSGGANSVNQTVTVDSTVMPPDYLGSGDYGNWNDAPYMIRITDTDGSTHLHYITAVDYVNDQLTIFPWLSADVDLAVEADYVYGGGLVFRGNDSNVSTFSGIDAKRCGMAVAAASLYAPTATRLTTQYCGIGLAIGRKPSGACLGGHFLGIYFEANVEDIVFISRPGGSTYHIIESEYALNLDKVVSLAATRSATKELHPTYQTLNTTRLSHTGRLYAYEKPIGGYSGADLEISLANREDNKVYTLWSDNPTVTLTFNANLRRLFGMDAVRVVVIGNGANNEPTGDITFINADGQPINGGTPGDPFVYSGATGPVEFICKTNDTSSRVVPISGGVYGGMAP